VSDEKDISLRAKSTMAYMMACLPVPGDLQVGFMACAPDDFIAVLVSDVARVH
jgi:hypothetical protein